MNAQHLIEANVRAHTVDGYSSFHMIAEAHERTIRDLVAQLNVLQGVGLRASRGCEIVEKVYGDITVSVEVEYEPGQREIVNAEPDYCQEGFEPTVSVLRVFLNGRWNDAQDVVPEATLERWECELREALAEGAEA